MSAPWGYTHRRDHGPRGWAARWWLRHRTESVKKALAHHNQNDKRGPYVNLRPDACQRLRQAGYLTQWQLDQDEAHGRTLAGEPVTLDADEFIDAFCVRH
jgi:hypothetical protein